jgi:hypothetical protein
MDPRKNPYTPNAGATPPVLVGRDRELEMFEILLDRLRAGKTEQSMIVTGLRGVGKTVLINEFRKIARERDWVVIEHEVSKVSDSEFREILAREIRTALLTIAPLEKWTERVRNAARILTSFVVTVDPTGNLTAGLGVDPLRGQADSGALEVDLPTLLVAVGEAAADHETGVLLSLDEIQFLSQPQLEGLISALHKTVQRGLPITLASAGLPQVARSVGVARSYAERLFKLPEIGRLSDSDAQKVLTGPATELGVSFTAEALTVGTRFTAGYPYFLQEFGQAVWNLSIGPQITGSEANAARADVESKLDSSFFRVRLDRTTDLERAYSPRHGRAGTGAAACRSGGQQAGANLPAVRADAVPADQQGTPLHTRLRLCSLHRSPVRPIPSTCAPGLRGSTKAAAAT